MNKIIRFTALSLCAVALLGSCKKKGTEPIQPGTEQPGQNPGSGNTGSGNNPGTTPGTNTPVDNTKGIKLVLADGQTEFAISGLTGAELTVEGTTADGALSTIGNNDTPKTFSASKAGATVVVKGNVTALRISKGTLKKLDLSQAPATLKTLITLGTTIESIDLSGATSLTLLSLRDYGTLKALDLSKLSQLEKVSLGAYESSQKQRSLTSVVWPEKNVIKSLFMGEISLSTFPLSSFTSLEALDMRGSGYGAFNQNFSLSNSKLKSFISFKVKHTKSLVLENNSQLTSVLYTGRRKDAGETTEVIIKGNPLLDKVSLTTDDVSAGITKIDLSNNAKLATLTIDNMSLFQSAGLRTVDLSGTALSESTIEAVLTHLPKGDNSSYKIKLTNPTDKLKAAVAAKQWVLQ